MANSAALSLPRSEKIEVSEKLCEAYSRGAASLERVCEAPQSAVHDIRTSVNIGRLVTTHGHLCHLLSRLDGTLSSLL